MKYYCYSATATTSTTTTRIYWPLFQDNLDKTIPERYKKLSYCQGTARCVMSVEILPIATQQCRNYLYDKS